MIQCVAMSSLSRLTTLSLMEDNLKAHDSVDITLRELIDILSERAFGLTLLFLALPNAIGLTLIPGISTIFGIPIILISLQLILGKDHLPLPKKLANYKLKRQDCLTFIAFSHPYIERLENFTKPRLLWFSSNMGLRITGMFSLILGIIIALPLPFGNFLGGISLLVLALGLAQDDGIFILIGYILATFISFAFLSVASYLLQVIQAYFTVFF